MKVLVTGGSGFIGQYVCRELLRMGHEPVVLDRYDRRALHGDVILGDVRDATAVTEAVAHVDGVIHLAAVLGTQETIENPRPAADVNINGSLNVFEAVTQYNVPCVYVGVGNHWMREHGAGAYTITKTCAEDLARMYVKHRGAHINIVRPVNAYGPGQSVGFPYGPSKVRKILPSFICRALTNCPIEVYGDGTQISDMVHVLDVARVMVAALGSAQTERPTEVGPIESVTVNEIAKLVIEIVGKGKIEHLPMRPGEVPNAVVSADTTTLAQVGVDPRSFVDLQGGVEETVRWFRENEWKTWKTLA